MTRRPRIAVLLTTYGERSHGMCFANKLIEGLDFLERTDPPRCDVVSMYLMEVADETAFAGPDIGLAMAAKHGIPLYHSVAAALCRGSEELDVDGVVIIGEHGDWPENDRGQLLYPRRELFDQVIGVFRQADRVVPVFNDKELSWSWKWAQHMWRQAQELGIPMLAGSNLPWSDFRPRIPLPNGRPIDHVVVVSWGGMGRYGSHTIDLGQFVVEQRPGGEVGGARVRCLVGQDAISRCDDMAPRDIIEAALLEAGRSPNLEDEWGPQCQIIDVEYLDGQRMTAFMINPNPKRRISLAYRVSGSSDVRAAGYTEDPPPRVRHITSLVRAIEEMMITGEPAIPLERVVLTTGLLAFAFDSIVRGGTWVRTPELGITYSPQPMPSNWREVLH
jgi:hypothetical protein